MTIGSTLDMQDVTGQWQFTMKKEDENLLINISLANGIALYQGADISIWSKKSIRRSDPALLIQSTGVFEQKVRAVVQQ